MVEGQLTVKVAETASVWEVNIIYAKYLKVKLWFFILIVIFILTIIRLLSCISNISIQKVQSVVTEAAISTLVGNDKTNCQFDRSSTYQHTNIQTNSILYWNSQYIYSSKYIACRQKQIYLQTEKKILTFFDINITNILIQSFYCKSLIV